MGSRMYQKMIKYLIINMKEKMKDLPIEKLFKNFTEANLKKTLKWKYIAWIGDEFENEDLIYAFLSPDALMVDEQKNFYIVYGKTQMRIEPPNLMNRDNLIKILNKIRVLCGEAEIRFLKDTIGYNKIAFMGLDREDWQDMEDLYRSKVHLVFSKIDEEAKIFSFSPEEVQEIIKVNKIKYEIPNIRREKLLIIKNNLENHAILEKYCTGETLKDALNSSDEFEKRIDKILAVFNEAKYGKFLQPVSDWERVECGGYRLKDISPAKKMRKLQKIIGEEKSSSQNSFSKILSGIFNKNKDYSLSVHELKLIAEKIATLAEEEKIRISSSDFYWKKFQILLSGILAVNNWEAMEELSSIVSDSFYEECNAESKKTIDDEREMHIKTLEQWWGIHDTASAMYTIHWLLKSGHASRYERFANCTSFEQAIETERKETLFWLKREHENEASPLPENLSFDEIIEIEVDDFIIEHYNELINNIVKSFDYYKKEFLFPDAELNDTSIEEIFKSFKGYYIEKFTEDHIETVNDTLEFIHRFGGEKPLCLNAWDIGRCANVIRWSYTCGYISEESAWEFLDKNARRAIAEYKSFGDFAKDYMLGRFFWQSSTGEEIDLESTYMMINSICYLFDKKIGMWTQNPWVESVLDN